MRLLEYLPTVSLIPTIHAVIISRFEVIEQKQTWHMGRNPAQLLKLALLDRNDAGPMRWYARH